MYFLFVDKHNISDFNSAVFNCYYDILLENSFNNILSIGT